MSEGSRRIIILSPDLIFVCIYEYRRTGLSHSGYMMCILYLGRKWFCVIDVRLISLHRSSRCTVAMGRGVSELFSPWRQNTCSPVDRLSLPATQPFRIKSRPARGVWPHAIAFRSGRLHRLAVRNGTGGSSTLLGCWVRVATLSPAFNMLTP